MMLACAPATSQPGADSSESTNADGDEPSTATSDDPSSTQDPVADTSSGSTEDPTASTTGDPVCGNGVVEADEQCDEDGPGCADCSFVCGLGEGVLLPAPLATLGGTITPVSLADDSGDLLFADYGSIYRGSADGAQVWGSYGDTDDYTRNVALVDGYAWSGWRLDHTADVRAAIKLHDLAEGDVLATIEVSDADESWDAYVHAAPDGTLVVSVLETVDVGVYRTVLQGRSPDAGDLLWSATPEPPPGHTSLSQIHIAADADGFFTSGSAWGESRNAVVMRFDAQGEPQWTWVDDTTAEISGSAFAGRPSVAPDGGVVIVASLRGSGTQASVGNLLSYDTRIVRLDAQGEVVLDLATNELAESGRVQLEGVAALDDGRVLAVGSRLVSGFGDAWLGYLADDGALLCDETTPDPGGIESSISDAFLGAQGELRVHGYADEASVGENSTVRQWVATLRPY
jgi:hypothetical protein